ncbi:HEAT repeat domain-containing protein [Allorhodopirellula solitaria]|uniref:HEAT repeat protein n=1 Tax=Allorhodopirellula solitaria TaxID=2527987 RepID=A0A5C5YDR6_9BACT|nr:HEAT repeat domain-containing protein [Allorhodopirellula solitaria]TWT73108.1 hypothetical protein CA85_15750 [Allorhodopirellula solitaria]
MSQRSPSIDSRPPSTAAIPRRDAVASESTHENQRGQLGPDERSGYEAGNEAQWGDTPNPFARVLAASEPTAKSRFLRAAKTLVATLALAALLLTGLFFGKQFLLSQLVASLDGLGSAGKQNRLTQIAGFGTDAIAPLVGQLVADEEAVSATAFELLRKMQNDWITLPPAAGRAAHDRLVDAIANTFAVSLGPPANVEPNDAAGRRAGCSPASRARAQELVQQSVLEFSATPSLNSELLVAANRLLGELEVAGASAVQSPALQPAAPQSAAPRARLVRSAARLRGAADSTPVQSGGRPSTPVQRSGWTDWPPPASMQTARIVRSTAGQTRLGVAASSPGNEGRLQEVPRGVTVPLGRVSSQESVAVGPVPETLQAPAAVVAARRPVDGVIQVAAHQEDASLDTLGSEELLELLGDADRRVRLQAASALAQTQDAAVLAALRQRVVDEPDPHVAARIRRILDLF